VKRAGMDYLLSAELARHESWASFEAQHRGRLVVEIPNFARAF